MRHVTGPEAAAPTDTVRAAVRFTLRAHICGLVPASDVNWLADFQLKATLLSEATSADRQ
jgi:hypothetical protein